MAAHGAKLTLTDEDRKYLEQVRDSRTEEMRRIERARILLAHGEGLSKARIAETVWVSVPTVRLCVEKALVFGPRAAPDDRRRTGRPRRTTSEARAWVVSLACGKPRDFGYSYEVWTQRLPARDNPTRWAS